GERRRTVGLGGHLQKERWRTVANAGGRCARELQNRWSASLAMSTDGSFPSRPRQFLNSASGLKHRQASYRPGSDRGSPNDGSTLFSKRVMALIRLPERVRTYRPTPWLMPVGARRYTPKAGWPFARVGTRSNLRPESKRLAQKRTTRSRPSYSNGIGGIAMKTSSVRRATSASRSADSHASTNFSTIASSAGELDAGGGSRSPVVEKRFCRVARARLR